MSQQDSFLFFIFFSSIYQINEIGRLSVSTTEHITSAKQGIVQIEVFRRFLLTVVALREMSVGNMKNRYWVRALARVCGKQWKLEAANRTPREAASWKRGNDNSHITAVNYIGKMYFVIRNMTSCRPFVCYVRTRSPYFPSFFLSYTLFLSKYLWVSLLSIQRNDGCFNFYSVFYFFVVVVCLLVS